MQIDGGARDAVVPNEREEHRPSALRRALGLKKLWGIRCAAKPGRTARGGGSLLPHPHPTAATNIKEFSNTSRRHSALGHLPSLPTRAGGLLSWSFPHACLPQAVSMLLRWSP